MRSLLSSVASHREKIGCGLAMSAALLLSGFAPFPAQAQPDWTLQSPATKPPGRYYHAMAFDAARAQAVMVGGVVVGGSGYPFSGTGYDGRTWIWDGLTWTGKTPSPAPSPRFGAMMAYDSVNQKTVLFGGYSNGTGSSALGVQVNDTWVWDGTGWTKMQPALSPPARKDAVMAYDELNRQVVLFGGDTTTDPDFADTWVYDVALNVWTQKFPVNAPLSTVAPDPKNGRRWSAMAYDAKRHNVVLFGGRGLTDLGDTWIWDGVNWTLASTTGPSPRAAHAMAYDPVRQNVVLFGGFNAANSFLAETWIWNGSWTQATPATIPPGSENSTMAFDGVNQKTMTFGGYVPPGVSGNDTWLFSGSGAAQTAVTITVPAGVQYSFNGSTYASSQSIKIAPGDYTLAVASPQLVASSTEYSFASWSDGGAQSHTVTVGSTNLNITGAFTVATKYLLTTIASPASGGTQNIVTGTYSPGTIVTLIATPNPGYAFSGWGGACSGTANCSLTMDAPKTAYAHYSGITVNVPASRQFTFNGTLYTGPQMIAILPGTYTLSISSPQTTGPGTQETFLGWNDGGAPTHNVTLGLDATSVTGTFRTQYTLTLVPSPASGGLVASLGGPFYNAGSVVQVTALANPGSTFAGWSGACSGSGACNVTMNAPATVTANFNVVKYNLTISVPSTVQYQLFGLPLTGTQTLSLPPGQYPLTLVTPQVNGPGSQLVFVSWSDSGAVSHTINLGSANLSVNGIFKTQYSVASSSAQPTQGAASFSGGPYIDAGTTVPIIAFANPGYELEYWTGDCSGSKIICFLPVFGPRNVVAHFGPIVIESDLYPAVSYGPSPRFGFSMAYDESTQQVVLFGGAPLGGGPYLSDTWLWNGTNWSTPFVISTIAGAPKGRNGHSMGYDPNTRTVVMVGGSLGIDNNGSPISSGETWAWDGRKFTWARNSDVINHRLGASLFRQRNNLYLFGGLSPTAVKNGIVSDGQLYNDLFRWDGADWIPVNTAHAPSARFFAPASYDSLHSKAVLVGGVTPLQGTNLTFYDTWTFDGIDWRQESPITPFTGLARSAAYDANLRQLIVLPVAGNMWSWNGTDWTTKEVTPVAAQIVYDSARQGIFAFGFNSSSLLSASTVRVAPRIGYAVAGPPVAYKDPGTGDYFVSLSFKNMGNIANFFTAFQKATLALQNYKSFDYVTGSDTPPGGLFTTTIRFPGSIGSGVKILSLSGTYFPGTGANTSFNFSANLVVTLP